MIIASYNHLKQALSDFEDDALIRLVYVSNINKKSKLDPSLFEHIRSHAEDYNRKIISGVCFVIIKNTFCSV